MHKLYNAYDNAHAKAGPNHVPNGGGATPVAAATAPPRSNVKVDDALFENTAADDGGAGR